MKHLWMIWTLPVCTVREKLNRTREWFWIRLAYRLPKRLRYWTFISVCNENTLPDEVVTDVTYMTVLGRAGK